MFVKRQHFLLLFCHLRHEPGPVNLDTLRLPRLHQRREHGQVFEALVEDFKLADRDFLPRGRVERRRQDAHFQGFFLRALPRAQGHHCGLDFLQQDRARQLRPVMPFIVHVKFILGFGCRPGATHNASQEHVDGRLEALKGRVHKFMPHDAVGAVLENRGPVADDLHPLALHLFDDLHHHQQVGFVGGFAFRFHFDARNNQFLFATLILFLRILEAGPARENNMDGGLHHAVGESLFPLRFEDAPILELQPQATLPALFVGLTVDGLLVGFQKTFPDVGDAVDNQNVCRPTNAQFDGVLQVGQTPRVLPMEYANARFVKQGFQRLERPLRIEHRHGFRAADGPVQADGDLRRGETFATAGKPLEGHFQKRPRVRQFREKPLVVHNPSCSRSSPQFAHSQIPSS